MGCRGDPGDGPCADEGRTVEDAGSRCTAVEMSTCRQQGPCALPTADQHVDFRPDQRGGPLSPGSTPVMTRMSERYRSFLQPQSGWGRAADRPGSDRPEM